jgi:hypothetical protein
MLKTFGSLIVILAVSVAVSQPARAEDSLKTKAPIVLPSPEAAAAGSSYPDPPLSKGKTYVALRTQQGTGTTVPEEDIIKHCSDKAGCNIHLGMYNWDGQARVASRQFLFYYNRDTGAWRTSDDIQGTNANNVVEQVYQSWNCYFTDGVYVNASGTDQDGRFNVLSWSPYNADCWLTIMVN